MLIVKTRKQEVHKGDDLFYVRLAVRIGPATEKVSLSSTGVRENHVVETRQTLEGVVWWSVEW
jgi:hypothetical protein